MLLPRLTGRQRLCSRHEATRALMGLLMDPLEMTLREIRGLPDIAGGTCETDWRNDDDAAIDPPSVAELRRDLAQRAEGIQPGVFVPGLHEDILCNTLLHFEHRICSEEELYVFRHYLERQFA